MATPPLSKTLDAKLARIVADPACRDFILADAKDADMVFGLAAPGVRPGGNAAGPFRTLAEYREGIREIVRQGLVDIMLMSASTGEVLAIDEGLFVGSTVTPAVRMNDTTDIWLATGTGSCPTQPALPFSTTTIAQARSGRVDGGRPAAGRGADLGLFSLTLNDDAAGDRGMLGASKAFRVEAEREGCRHFLEVFFPNALGRVSGRCSSRSPTPGPRSRRCSRPTTGRSSSASSAAAPAPRSTRSHSWPTPRPTAFASRSSAARSTRPSTSSRSSRSCGPWPTATCPSRFGFYGQGSKAAFTISDARHSPARCAIYTGRRMAKDEVAWTAAQPEPKPYRREWEHLVDAIVNDKPHNEAVRGAEASLVAAMGRCAAHVGRPVTYQEMLESTDDMTAGVAELTDGSPAPLLADTNGRYPVPMSGRFKHEYHD